MRNYNAKVPDVIIITDIDKIVFEGRYQDVPSHRNFTSKERHLDENPSDLRKRLQIVPGAATNTLKATTQRILRPSSMTISRGYRSNRMFERPCIKRTIFIDTMAGRYKSLDGNQYRVVPSPDEKSSLVAINITC